MSIFNKLQPILDAAQDEMVGKDSDPQKAVEFANALLSRAAGTIANMAPPGRGDAMVCEWLALWILAAKERQAMGAGHVRH